MLKFMMVEVFDLSLKDYQKFMLKFMMVEVYDGIVSILNGKHITGVLLFHTFNGGQQCCSSPEIFEDQVC